jgi:glycosyltransferase involved in cell wall biosynthesis
MAMARPVVAAPVGSTAELVLDGATGLLAQTGDAASFARAIARLLTDAPLRSALGQAARAHVLQGYTDDIMAQKTENFYRLLLSRKKAA